MTCEELMKRDVECVSERDTIQHAAERMRDANIGFIPVCDGAGNVLGTLTDRDIAIRVVADNRPSTVQVADVMTRERVDCRPSDTLERAEQLMQERHKSRLLVCDKDGKLLGVISLSDIAQAADDRSVAQTLRNISGREARA